MCLYWSVVKRKLQKQFNLKRSNLNISFSKDFKKCWCIFIIFNTWLWISEALSTVLIFSASYWKSCLFLLDTKQVSLTPTLQATPFFLCPWSLFRTRTATVSGHRQKLVDASPQKSILGWKAALSSNAIENHMTAVDAISINLKNGKYNETKLCIYK